MSSVLVRIVEAVADSRQESVDALDPIASSFDSEALEQFIDSAAVPTKITIELDSCTVIIDGDGNVAVLADERP